MAAGGMDSSWNVDMLYLGEGEKSWSGRARRHAKRQAFAAESGTPNGVECGAVPHPADNPTGIV
jgi:hypothetical protein